MKFFSLSFSILFITQLFSQNNSIAETSYLEYFSHQRESLFLHLNKTTYITGEEIWFKCYAYDRKNEVSFKNTSNISIGLYDSNGKQIKKGLFLAKEGNTYGSFLIDSTFAAGDYYVKASTNWMRNFKEDDSFIQKIKIINSDYNEQDNSLDGYDIQFLPEGGHAIANAKNSIGVKITDRNARGLEYTGVVFNDINEVVAKFNSNHLGLSKFSLWMHENTQYKVTITFKNGETIDKELLKAESHGISLSVDNSKSENIIISLYTNSVTLEKIKNKAYKIAIHKNGMMKTLPFAFENSTRKSLAINKKALFNGINTITIIDSENRPINERLIFNDISIKNNNIYLSQINKASDSITFSIYQSSTKNLNISISILPETTISNNPEDNILSAFYLKPYLKGYIETPCYYFRDTDFKKKQDLDVLLLNQGWSRYEWNDIFNNPPKPIYNFEQGIALKGSINIIKDADSLYLYSTKYYSAQFIPLSKEKTFSIDNFYVLENEVLKFSYVNNKMQFQKPNLYLTYHTTKFSDSINSDLLSIKKQHVSIIKPNSKNTFYDDTVNLKEVIISNSKKPKEKLETFDLSFKNTTKIFDEEAGLTYPDVLLYIKINGYDVLQTFGQVVIRSRIPNSISGEQYPPPSIYLDGVLLQDFNILYELPTANIKKISIDKSGLGQGLSGGSGGVIRIYMKENSVFDIKKATKTSSTYLISEPTVGFTAAKRFYTPKYTSYTNRTFQDFGIISWYPEINLQKNVSSPIKAINTQTESITFYIEGIADDGSLISEKKTIMIK